MFTLRSPACVAGEGLNAQEGEMGIDGVRS